MDVRVVANITWRMGLSGLLLLLAGCAIKTPARHTLITPPDPLVAPLDHLPGTGASAVEYVAAAIEAEPGPAAGGRADGCLEFIGADQELFALQHRSDERGSLFWHGDEEQLSFLYAWQPDVPRILASKIDRAADEATELGRDLSRGLPADEIEAYVIRLESADAVRASDYWGVRGALYPSKTGDTAGGLLYLISGIGGPMNKELKAINDLQERGWWVVNLRFPELLSERRVRRALNAWPAPHQPPSSTGDDDASSSEDEPARLADVRVLPDPVYLCFESALAACVSDLFLATSVLAFQEIDEQVQAAIAGVCGPARALVGVSYGAIATPSLLASGHAAFDSVVLVGGGANLYLAAEDLGLLEWTRDEMMEGWAPRTGAPDHELSEQAFLNTCDLDPWHWAPGLAGMRVLQVHAMFDAIVSARCGRLLYERLDRPERWEYPYGHLLLMAFMPTSDIIRWIEAAPTPQDRAVARRVRERSDGHVSTPVGDTVH